MCLNCPGMVDLCTDDECKISDSQYGGRPYFEIGDRYCKHLAEKYGHPVATESDYYGWDDDDAEETGNTKSTY